MYLKSNYKILSKSCILNANKYSYFQYLSCKYLCMKYYPSVSLSNTIQLCGKLQNSVRITYKTSMQEKQSCFNSVKFLCFQTGKFP